MDGLKVIDADTLAIAWEKFQVHVKQTTNHKNASEYNNECTHIRVYCCFVVLLFSVHILYTTIPRRTEWILPIL